MTKTELIFRAKVSDHTLLNLKWTKFKTYSFWKKFYQNIEYFFFLGTPKPYKTLGGNRLSNKRYHAAEFGYDNLL